MAAPTVFLSRLIGIAALILSAAMFVAKPPMVAAVEQIGEGRGPSLLFGLAGVVAGLAIVLTHNLWSKGLWPLVVTLCGWAILVRGALLLVLPASLLGSLVDAMHYTENHYWYAVVPLVLGTYLSFRGFTAPRAAAPAASPSPPAKPPEPGTRR